MGKGGYMKRLISSILTLVLVLTLFVPASYAAKWDYEEIPAVVEQTNNEIDRLIEEAVYQASQVDELGDKAEKEINKIIEKLVKETDKLSEKVIKEAGKVGALVICEYIPVEIGGQIIMIDPLIVVTI